MDMPRPTPTSRTTLNTSSWHLPSSATSLSLSSSCVSDNSCRMPTFRHLSDLVFITSASGSLQAVNDSHILNTWCIINATGYKHTHTTTQTHVHRNGHHTHTCPQKRPPSQAIGSHSSTILIQFACFHTKRTWQIQLYQNLVGTDTRRSVKSRIPVLVSYAPELLDFFCAHLLSHPHQFHQHQFHHCISLVT